MKLRDQVAIVTGGGRGIGKATALRLSGEGCRVVIAARTQEEIETTADEISKAGQEALAVPTDVRSRKETDRLVKESVGRFGRVDILVNNAGVGYRRPFIETSEAEWRETIDTNLTGKFLCTRAVLPHMLRQGSGRIVNVSSGAGKYGFPSLVAYCASKFGVVGFTESLAREVGSLGVKVYAVCPGGVNTKMHRHNYPEDNPAFLLKPEVVAKKIVELCMPGCRVTPGKCVDLSWNPISSLTNRIFP